MTMVMLNFTLRNIKRSVSAIFITVLCFIYFLVINARISPERYFIIKNI